MNPKQTFYEHQANTIIANLKKRQMDGFYCPTCKDAVKTAMELVSTGDSVSFGGSMTLSESGIMDALNAREDITLYDRSKASTPEEIGTIYRKAFSCDTYFMSTNAITLDGELVNTDGNGNRVAALIFGPAQVIIVCGMNKVANGYRRCYRKSTQHRLSTKLQPFEQKDSMCHHRCLCRLSFP